MTEFINVVIPPLGSPLTYEVPERLEKTISVGSRVSVPLGTRQATGFVVGKQLPEQKDGKKFAIKKINAATHTEPCFLPEQLEFFRWVAEYYGDSLSNVIDVAIPPSVPIKLEKNVRLSTQSTEQGSLKGKLQKLLFEHLTQCPGGVPLSILSRQFKGASAALKALEEKKIIEISSKEILSDQNRTVSEWAKKEVLLSDAQQGALKKILGAVSEKRPEPFLLYGVTGSGKTEVYIEAIRDCIAKGLGALVIVPEIALTPQLVDRFQARLGDDVAVLHSGLHKRIRWDSWRSLIRGEKLIAIGARSAVFAPVHNLGLIIVDEEHDSSYKQNEGLRYNARDLAIVRAKFSKCPVVLGTATPSLESVHNCDLKKFTPLTLSKRHSSGSSTTVEIIDLNQIKPWEMPSKNISPRLADAIYNALAQNEQSFLLYNRRGFANYFQCNKCEQSLVCPNCSVTMTYHQFNHSLVCHYCSLTIPPPSVCGQCPESAEATPGTYELRGSGTEKTQEELKELFPDARIARLDRDVVTDIESYEAVLNSVRNREIDILVGTQMIAKGHDLPEVTLAAVVDCDVGLHMPDFRSSERIFHLLTQLSGRAGRGAKPGLVLLQTRVPRHPSLTYTMQKDFFGFARTELENRQALLYPPFSRLLRIVASSKEESLALQLLGQIAGFSTKFEEAHSLGLTLLGPAPCPLSKLKTEWRWHLLVKSQKPTSLVKLITFLKDAFPKQKQVKIIYDLDPQEML